MARRIERAFAWGGGALFVASLSFCAYTYLVRWGHPRPLDIGAAAIDAALFAVFAAHHSLFARARVKAFVSQAVPDRMVRSVYVWTASALLVLLSAAWQPIGGELFRATGVRLAFHVLVQVCGVWLIGRSVGAIDALELAGIRQPLPADSLQVAGPYRWVRHPLYFGWILVTFGAAHMTGDRFFFAAISLFYLVLAIPFEERSLLASFGEAYAAYRRRVRWRLVPYVY